MTITPEQFNKIATKEDVKQSIQESEERVRKDISGVLSAVDGVAKEFKDHKTEHTANLAAHDRMQGEINDIKDNIGMKSVPIKDVI